MGESFSDLRKNSRALDHKPDVVERKRSGPVLGQAKVVGMKAMEKAASKSSPAKKEGPVRKRADGGQVSWLPEGPGSSGFPSIVNHPQTPSQSTPAAANLAPAPGAARANSAAGQMQNAAAARGASAMAASKR